MRSHKLPCQQSRDLKVATNAKDFQLFLTWETLYHRRVLVAPRANKESIDVLLRDELEGDAVVDQEDEPELILLLDAVSVLVGGDAVDARPGKKAQPESTATTKLLPGPVSGHCLHQIQDSRWDVRCSAVSLMKAIRRVVGFDRPPSWFHQGPTPQRKRLPHFEVGHPDGELLHSLGQVSDTLGESDDITWSWSPVHANSPQGELWSDSWMEDWPWKSQTRKVDEVYRDEVAKVQNAKERKPRWWSPREIQGKCQRETKARKSSRNG